MRKLFLIVMVAALATPQVLCGDIITRWDFNSSIPDAMTGTGTLFPSVGAGTVNLVGGVTSTFASGDANGGSSDPATGDDSGLNSTTYAGQGLENGLRGVSYLAATSGFTNISVNYDLRHSNTSSRFEGVQYTLNGGTTWVDAAVFDGPAGDTWFNGRSINLSAISGANNNPNFGFRVVAIFAPGTGGYAASNAGSTYAGGTWRFDAVTINGTAIPEPSAMAILGVAGAIGALRRRRIG